MNTESEFGSASQTEAPAIPVGPHGQVRIAPPDSWVAIREVDWDFRAEREGLTTPLLIDHQHHAEQRTSYHRSVQRLETLHAVHQAAQWKLDFDPQTQQPTVHTISIRRGGETISHTDPERFRYLQRETELERLTIHGGMTLVVVLEDIRIGDILDVSYSFRDTPRLLADRYAVIAACPSAQSVRAFHFSVRFANNRPMRWLSGVENQKPVLKTDGEETDWEWLLERTVQIDHEQNVPTWHISEHWIQVSDCASWEEVSARVNSAWQESFDGALLSETANRIAAENAVIIDRVEAAVRFVQDDIRYLSHNVEFGGHTPTGPERVLRQRFGDCKDKSFLLAHLLRRLGVPARPVLVHSSLKGHVRDYLPMLGIFNHVVVEFEIEGERRTVDPTVPLQGGGPLKRFVESYQVGLPVAPGVKDLEPLVNAGDSGSSYELNEHFFLDTAGGPTLLKIRVRAEGRDADNLRAALALEGRESYAHRREQLYKQLFPEVRRVRPLEITDDRTANVFHVTECFELVGALTKTSDRKFSAFIYRSHLIQSALALPEGGKRHQPFAIHYPCRLQHDIEIESPAIDPQPTVTKAKKDNAFRLSADTQVRSGRIACRFRLQTFEDHVNPERFSHFRRRVEDATRYLVIQAVIPVGVAQPRRRLPATLQSTPSGVKRPDAVTGPVAALESERQENPVSATPVPSGGLLPSDPAPPLTSRGPHAAESQAARKEPFEAIVPAPAREGARESSVQEKLTASTGQLRDRRRHRSRSRRSRGSHAQRRRFVWGIIGCMALICAVIIIALLTRH